VLLPAKGAFDLACLPVLILRKPPTRLGRLLSEHDEPPVTYVQFNWALDGRR